MLRISRRILSARFWRRATAFTAVAVVGGLVVASQNSQAQTVTQSLWTSTEKPVTASVSDRKSLELGVKFKTSKAGSVTGIRFYKGGSNNGGTHIGNLWSSTGQRLATATFRNETSTGWQTVSFANPVAVSADTTYIASYFAPQGRYAQDANYFTTSRSRGPLTAPGSDVGIQNGVHVYSSSSKFPTNSYAASNYWVDVLFSYDDIPTSPTPGPVGSMSASGTSQTSLTLTWTTPSYIGTSPITGYKVSWVESGTGRTWTSTAPHYSLTDSPLTISDLTVGTSYAVTVTPLNASGEGTPTTRTASTIPASASSSNIVGGYWQMWDGPLVSEITANAPQYNLQYAAFAMGSNNSGGVAFNPVFEAPAQLKTDIAASKAAGSTWLLSIGGGSDSAIRLLTEAHATNMFNSLVPIIDTYGFQGIDIDIECGSACWSPTAAASLAQKLKTKYGSSFVISAAPRPYEARSSGTIYAQFALLAGNNLDYFGLQFYDFPETRNTSQLASIVDSDLAAITGYGVPASKILIGCITYSQYQYGWNTTAVYRDIYQQQKQKYPGLKGVFVWDTAYDKLESWSFARTMGQTVRGL